MQLLLAAVMATAEICARPVDGGVGEPQYCRLEFAQEIATPHFSLFVEPGFYVGVDRHGRRLRLQSTVFKNLDHLSIEVMDGSNPPNWAGCPKVRKTFEDGVKWQDCRTSSGGIHSRRLAAILEGRHVVIEYSYEALSTPSAPALERMTQSIRIIAGPGVTVSD